MGLSSSSSMVLNTNMNCYGEKEGWRWKIVRLLGTGKRKSSEKESVLLYLDLGHVALVARCAITLNLLSNLGCIDI